MLIQTLSNAERYAEEALKNPYRGCIVYFPKIWVKRIRGGVIKEVVRPFIPRYGFVQDSNGFRVVKASPGVSRVISFGGQAVERAVEEIKKREKNGYVQLDRPLSDGFDDFKKGDLVRVTGDVPFSGYLGIFETHSGAMRAKILLEYIGGRVRVELNRFSLIRETVTA